jgi:hypothetical protein
MTLFSRLNGNIFIKKKERGLPEMILPSSVRNKLPLRDWKTREIEVDEAGSLSSREYLSPRRQHSGSRYIASVLAEKMSLMHR